MKSNNKICTKLLALGSTLAVLGATGQAGLAQSDEDAGQLPPVMIISEAPQTESRSVTLLSGDTITLGGIQEVRDIQTALPNFTVFDANNTRMPKFSVRGLRENSFGVGQSAVGIYVDGIPYTDMMSRGLSLYDVDHIEFLRGPQGTLFGASAAPGGIINVRTRQPGAEWVGSAGLGYGDHGTQEYRLNASGPLTEQIGVSFSSLYNDRDGFVTNLPTGQDIDGRESVAGRLQFVLTPSEPWTIRLTASSERYDDGFTPTYSPLSDAGPFRVSRDVPGYVNTDVTTYALSADFSGENFTLDQMVTSLSILGHLDAALPSGPESRWDRTNRVTVTLSSGVLESVSSLSLFEGHNRCAIQSAHGQWEIVQFRDAELVAANQFDLSMLLRGQFGSEQAMANGHPIGSRFVLLDGSLAQAGVSLAERELELNWLYGPTSKATSDDTYLIQQMTPHAIGLKPLSPVHVRGHRLENGDVGISWIRRSRMDADSWSSLSVPLGEESEEYEVEVMSEGDAVRVLSATNPSVTYTAAHQTADFGGAVSEISLRIYQLSQTVGAGTKREVVLHV